MDRWTTLELESVQDHKLDLEQIFRTWAIQFAGSQARLSMAWAAEPGIPAAMAAATSRLETRALKGCILGGSIMVRESSIISLTVPTW